jgi:hypothetical protein
LQNIKEENIDEKMLDWLKDKVWAAEVSTFLHRQ